MNDGASSLGRWWFWRASKVRCFAAAAAATVGAITLAFPNAMAHAQCQSAKLTAEDAAEGDNFGAGVAVSGDLVLVGSPSDDDEGSASGGAYIFARDHGGLNHWGHFTNWPGPQRECSHPIRREPGGGRARSHL